MRLLIFSFLFSFPFIEQMGEMRDLGHNVDFNQGMSQVCCSSIYECLNFWNLFFVDFNWFEASFIFLFLFFYFYYFKILVL